MNTKLIIKDADLMKTALGLLKKLNDVKTLPQVAVRLSQLIADENSPIAAKFTESGRK